MTPVDNVFALFDQSYRLALFNQKLAAVWGLPLDWLQTQPDAQAVFAAIEERGYWSQAQSQKLIAALYSTTTENVCFYIEQSNGLCLQVYTTVTSDGGRMFNFCNVTDAQGCQANLNAETRRQVFLLGLMERLQPASKLPEIGRFALSYLVQVMGAAFGDIKVINGQGLEATASILTNQLTADFIATYGEAAVAAMAARLKQGIPYGQGLLWQVVESGLPLFVEDYHNYPQAVPEFRHPAIGQLGIFPIIADNGNVIGVLTLESRSLQKLQDAPQQELLLAACRVLGVAVERAQHQALLNQINVDLEQASHLKSEFLASMSHELRTPLSSILGFSTLLLEPAFGTLNERQTKYLHVVEQSGQHLLQLINDILDLSKIESGKVELKLQPVSIPDLCAQCLRMMQQSADKKRLELSLELDYRLHPVNLDERRVRQMLINLLSNAVKFTLEGGKIKLSCHLNYGSQLQAEFRPNRSPVSPTTPYLCLEVKDTGIGIPQSHWHLLFRPFQQIDASLTRRHEGTGLGLALTKRLAELHGGTVSLESVENQGSAFRIWLPLAEMDSELAVANSTISEPSIASPQNQNVNSVGARWLWVVEDQPYNQALSLEVLELEGYTVELIADGQTMLEAIQSHATTSSKLPDLVLLDLQLPLVDGFQVLGHLKATPEWQQVPVIVVTAMAMVGDRERCLAAGANAYLSKPLDLNLLRETVRTVLNSVSSIPGS